MATRRSKRERKKEFVIKDSGSKTEFASGMVRDADVKVDLTLPFNGPMFKRWASLLDRAQSSKYPNLPDGSPNWMLANSQHELDRARKSLMNHVVALLEGKRDEDHAAAIIFNVNLYEYTRDRMEAGNGSTTTE